MCGIHGGICRLFSARYAPVHLLLSTGCLTDPPVSGRHRVD